MDILSLISDFIDSLDLFEWAFLTIQVFELKGCAHPQNL